MSSSKASGGEPILLAFSGGLDTSFCVPWLKETYGRPVITVTVDTGGIDAAGAKVLAERAAQLGALEHHLIDARADYFEQVLKFLIMGNMRRGQLYPMCVGAERVLQAQVIARMALQMGTRMVAHGCTAAGNDQVRFEVALRTLAPELDAIVGPDGRIYTPIARIVSDDKTVAGTVEELKCKNGAVFQEGVQIVAPDGAYLIRHAHNHLHHSQRGRHGRPHSTGSLSHQSHLT